MQFLSPSINHFLRPKIFNVHCKNGALIEANNNFSASLPVPLGLVLEYFSFVLPALSGMLHSLYISLSVLVWLFLCQSISLTHAHKHSDDETK